MSGKACSMCLRDECDRCHDSQCVCCGAGVLAFPQLAGSDNDWEYEDDSPVGWPKGLSY